MSARDKMPDQIERAFQLRRQCDDARVGARRVDLVENGASVELGTRTPCTHRTRRTPQTPYRLRATILGVDEIAFEMGGQHAG